MTLNTYKLNSIDTTFIDKTNIFLEAQSPRWRSPMKISLEDILNEVSYIRTQPYNISEHIDNDTIIIDPSTLKIKINSALNNNSCNVFSEPFNEHNISYYQPPINVSTLSSMHMVTDENYLYVWVGNRWKRTLLSEW
jgi:hypothetical protein